MTRPDLGANPSENASNARRIDAPQNLSLNSGAFLPGTPANVVGFIPGASSQFDFTGQSAQPTNPGTGLGRLYAQLMAGKPHPKMVDQWGDDKTLQPHFGRNKIGMWIPVPAGTSGTLIGMSAVSTTGTPTARTFSATNSITRATRVGFLSASGTAGSLCELRSNSTWFTSGTGAASGGGGFLSIQRFAVTDAAAVSGARMFVGMSSSATSAATNVEPNALTNSIGVAQLSTDATQFYLVYGGTTAQTAIALGTALGAPTTTTNEYELIIWSPPSLLRGFYVELRNVTTGATSWGTFSGLVGGSGASSTLVPSEVTPLGWKFFRTNNAQTAAVAFDAMSVYTEQDN